MLCIVTRGRGVGRTFPAGVAWGERRDGVPSICLGAVGSSGGAGGTPQLLALDEGLGPAPGVGLGLALLVSNGLAVHVVEVAPAIKKQLL